MQDVTGEPADPSWNEPLWTDERINEYISTVLFNQPGHTPRGLVRRVSYAIRDEYERDRANFQAIYEQYISKPDADDADRARLVARVDRMGGLLDLYKADADNLLTRITELEHELVRVLDVAIARGERLDYDSDDDYRERYRELTGKGWQDDE